MNCKYCRANCTGAKQDREIAMCLSYDPPKTNAECIREKSDEELAEWMVGEQINGIYAFLKGLEDDDLLHDFIEVINSHGAEEIKKEKLEWLKQEANP